MITKKIFRPKQVYYKLMGFYEHGNWSSGFIENTDSSAQLSEY
jgi:hypothetical protein